MIVSFQRHSFRLRGVEERSHCNITLDLESIQPFVAEDNELGEFARCVVELASVYAAKISNGYAVAQYWANG